jgi:Fe-S-cluster containining protein
MLPPFKSDLKLTPDEYFAMLGKNRNGDGGGSAHEKKQGAADREIMQAFDIPELIELCERMEKDFEHLRGEPVLHLKKLLNYMDKVNDILRPYCPCKKGCSCCCYVHVLVTSFEVAFIQDYLDKNRIKNYRRKTIEEIIVQNLNASGEEKYVGRKCPFLESNECGIYPARPFYCRKYISFEMDNKKCRSSENEILLFTTPTIDRSYESILKYYLTAIGSNEANRAVSGDIRDFFTGVNC